MPNLVAGSLELQDLSAGYWFEFKSGGLDSLFSIRGSDFILPGRPGRWQGERQPDVLLPVLTGIAFGEAGGGDTAGQSYLGRILALRTALDPAGDPVTFTIHPTARGVGGELDGGQTATLTARVLRYTGPSSFGNQWREFDIELECIDVPPVWVIA